MYLGSVRKDVSMDWYMAPFDDFTHFEGVIQAEMNQRGGAPFIHVTFETHQHAKRAKRTIDNPLREAMGQYGGEDKTSISAVSHAERLIDDMAVAQLRHSQESSPHHCSTNLPRHMGKSGTETATTSTAL